ncbi:MAG: FixH family protein [Ferruginibacter sp.]
MNWGYKILVVYIVFVLGILFMVFKSSTQNVDLVTTDYYAKELKYQEKIDEMNRVETLSAPVKYVMKDNFLVIQFPKDFAGKKLVGEVVLYCPSDEAKDITKNFSVQDEPVQLTIPAAGNRLYELHVSWRDGTVTYYFEKKIFI